MDEQSTQLLRRWRRALLRIWLGIREWCGDATYERYARSHAKHSCESALLTPEEFYLEQLQKHYSRLSRCC